MRAEKLKDVKETCLAFWEFLVNIQYSILVRQNAYYVKYLRIKLVYEILKKEMFFPPAGRTI